MPRILFVAAHRPNRSPSQRFRFEQYLDFLRSNGFECHVACLISKRTDKIFYLHKSVFRKALIFLNCIIRRLHHVLQSSAYDIIFIQREAWMTGSIFFEKQFKRSGARLVFDFDDAIWKHDVSDANKHLAFLKKPDKTEKIIAMSHLVIAGNNYLADYALKFNPNVIVIPTTIDTEHYSKTKSNHGIEKICIGWSGSVTTIKHFDFIVPVLKQLKERFADKVYFKVIGDKNYINHELNIKGIGWNYENEIEELCEIDIGVMPLPDDEWTRGKCGLKGLQFMALEIATIMSPVGVNNEIITDGENGFLAGEPDEWLKKISLLIEDISLRKNMGIAGRKTVQEKYSVNSQRGNYLHTLNNLLN